jgi:hypothetical protein
MFFNQKYSVKFHSGSRNLQKLAGLQPVGAFFADLGDGAGLVGGDVVGGQRVPPTVVGALVDERFGAAFE